MPVRLTPQQAKAYGLRTPKATAATPRQRFHGYASSWERDYAAYLTQDAQVRTWQYEAIRLILAPKTTYLPDFCVVDVRGKISFHEVKGFFREAAKVRFKLAVHLFPQFKFFIVRRVRNQWEIEAF